MEILLELAGRLLLNRMWISNLLVIWDTVSSSPILVTIYWTRLRLTSSPMLLHQMTLTTGLGSFFMSSDILIHSMSP